MGVAEGNAISPIESGIYNAYERGYGQADDSRKSGLTTAGDMSNSDLSARVNMENTRVAAEANALYKQGMIDAKTYSNINDVNQRKAAANKRLSDALENDPQYMQAAMELGMIKDPSKKPGDTKRAQANMAAAAKRVADALGVTDEFEQYDTLLDDLYKKAGLPPVSSGRRATGSAISGAKITRVN